MNNYLKIVITLALGCILAMLFSLILEKGQVRYYVHRYDRMQEIFIDSTPYDVIYIGSSRTHTTINPVIIDSITGLNTYNAGVEGGGLLEFKLALDGYLEKHIPPRMVILSLDGVSFNPNAVMFFPLQYFWVMQNHKVAAAIKANKEYTYLYVRYLKFLRQIYYDDYTRVLSLRGLLGQTELAGRKGYATNFFHCADTMQQYQVQQIIIDKTKLGTLQAIIDTCQKRNIRLVITYAPEYDFRLQASMKNFGKFIQTVNEFASVYKIPFFRDDSLAMCKDSCLFANYGHVNTYGAIAYSKILGRRIADSLLEK